MNTLIKPSIDILSYFINETFKSIMLFEIRVILNKPPTNFAFQLNNEKNHTTPLIHYSHVNKIYLCTK